MTSSGSQPTSVPRALALASVLLLIAFAASSALAVQAYVTYGTVSSRTSDVLATSNGLLIELLNAETGQRGYLLTSRPGYLQPYQKALSTIPAEQQRLDSQTSRIPGSRQDVARLGTLVQAKMAELAETINLANRGQHALALRIVDTNEGKRIMDRARLAIADVQRVTTRANDSRRSDLRTKLTVFAVLAGVIGILVVGIIVFFRRRLRRAAEDLGSLNATLEQRVQDRTLHLQRANGYMDAFTYSVAHDMRTPLRGMSGFAEILVEDYGDRLDETGRDYAARVQAGCARLATLTDDLLHLSRVTQAKMNLQDLDLSSEVSEICDDLAASDPGRQVQVTVQEGVRATADRALIRSLLESLLGNAWKFTARRDDAAIEFATTPVGDAPICCYVRDNGAGFDPIYTAKLFQPFQRLHDLHEFSGTGMGLATVRRIVERHSGRAWAEGAVGGGATIYFTLNARDTDE